MKILLVEDEKRMAQALKDQAKGDPYAYTDADGKKRT